MNRFKFRFFKTENNHMYYNVEKNSDDVFEEDNTMFGDLIDRKDDIGYLMQCASLKDKNDKLIYEHDILECYDGKFGNKFAIVKWNQSEVSFELFNPDDVYHDDDGNCEGDGISYFDHYDKFEVVGNIHENDDFEFNYLKRSLAKTN